MPFTALSRVTLNPGRYESPAVSLEGNKNCNFAFNASLNSTGWDAATLLVTLEVLQSTDGGASYRVIKSANFVGGSRGKGGGMPSISVVPTGDTVLRGQYKIALTINRRMAIGVNGIETL